MPAAPGPPLRPPLTYLHAGAFSGSAVSLREALATLADVEPVDIMPLARHPRLLPYRMLARREAAAAGSGVPWTKTATWSRAVQRQLTRAGVLSGRVPLLVVQSLPALELGARQRYAVYTDRVGREGAAVGGAHASRFSPGWLARETAFLRGAARVFVMGPSTARVVVDEYAVPAERVRIVGAGPNTRLGAARPRRRARRLLFVGTQWDLKGGPTLLAAYGMLRREYPGIDLVLVGSQPAGRLPEGVRALGRVPHEAMDAIYDDADVLVVPTHQEAFGIALVEGLVKGLPCVSTIVGNQPWIVGAAGLAVVPGQVPALAAAVRAVLDDFAAYHHRALQRGEELRATMTWARVARTIVTEFGDA